MDAYAHGGWTGGVTNAHALRRRNDIHRRVRELQAEAKTVIRRISRRLVELELRRQ
jgi:hypothetical protein